MNKEQSFFAMADRCKYIQRWSLMRNSQAENVAEHSFQTAVIAHGLAVIRLERFPELKPLLDPRDVLAAALFHDVSEVITGDLPTPVKYQDPDLKKAYKRIEALAAEDLLSMLPENFRKHYEPWLSEETAGSAERREILALVKAADKLSAYLKCKAEILQGNSEFTEAAESVLEGLRALERPEAEVFLNEFAPAFELSLDELRRGRRNGRPPVV